MRPVLFILLLLLSTTSVWAQAGGTGGAPPPPLDYSEARWMYNRATSWGCYSDAIRMMGPLSTLLKLNPGMTPDQRLAELDKNMGRVIWSATFNGFYASAVKEGERVLSVAPNFPFLTLWTSLIVAGHRGHMPAVVDRYLPTAIKMFEGMAKASPEGALAAVPGMFAMRTFEFARELEKNPEISDAAVIQRFATIHQILRGATRVSKTSFGQGLLMWEAERFWYSELRKRALNSSDAKMVQALRAAFSQGAETCYQITKSSAQIKGDDFEVGWFLGQTDYVLQVADGLLESRNPQQALSFLDNAANQLQSIIELAARDDSSLKLYLDYQAKNYGATLPVDPQQLKFTESAGEVARLRFRLHQLRARAYQDQHKFDPMIEELVKAYQLRQSWIGYLGLEEMEWDLIARSLKLPLPGMLESTSRRIDRALSDAERFNFRPGQILGLTYKGEFLAANGDSKAAIEVLTKATALAEQHVSESGGTQEGSAKLRSSYKRAFELLARLQLEAGNGQEAFVTLARAGNLGGLENVQHPQVDALRERTRSLEEQIAQEKAGGRPAQESEQLLASTKAQFFTTLAEIRRQNPRYEAMLAVRPVNFAKQQASIPEEMAVVQYFPADDKLFIFVVTKTDFKIREVKVSYAELKTQVTAFRRATLAHKGLTDPALVDSLSTLYNHLFAPVAGDVQGKKVVAFIPTGSLSYLPFSALINRNGDKLEFLAEKVASVTLLKSGDLEQLGNAAPGKAGGVLALGNPDGSLPAAEVEAKAVAELFSSKAIVGREATPAKLQKAGQVGYLHLATHAVMNSKDPSASYLALAGSNLAVGDIYAISLPGVRLVTLSACQTALGEVEAGSELQTLADAFSIAGSPSVVASLWSVSDESTKDLMLEFYQQVKAGKDLASALQAAQVKLIRGSKFSAPFYWSPFVLIGDWR